MSRIGKTPIIIPAGVTLTVADTRATVKGPKGELTSPIPGGMHVAQKDATVEITTSRRDKPGKALYGLTRALIANNVAGVTTGFSKTLELVGVGYRVSLSGVNLVLSVGFSHQVTVKPPSGILFTITDGKIIVTGCDKQLVGQVAADIRAVKPPEPYKGKGIRYEGERVRRKAGKSAKAVGGK